MLSIAETSTFLLVLISSQLFKASFCLHPLVLFVQALSSLPWVALTASYWISHLKPLFPPKESHATGELHQCKTNHTIPSLPSSLRVVYTLAWDAMRLIIWWLLSSPTSLFACKAFQLPSMVQPLLVLKDQVQGCARPFLAYSCPPCYTPTGSSASLLVLQQLSIDPHHNINHALSCLPSLNDHMTVLYVFNNHQLNV